MPNLTRDTSSVWSQLSSDLRRYIRRRVPDDPTADDLLQETFVRIHSGLAMLSNDDRLKSWVYRIAHNVLIDYYRKRSAEPVSLDCTEDVSAEHAPADDDHFRSRIIENASTWLTEIIETLPTRYREVVQLSEVEGLAQQEIADRLGLTLSATKSRIQRGRLALKESLLRCCQFEFDRRGNLTSCDPLPDRTVCFGCNDNNKH